MRRDERMERLIGPTVEGLGYELVGVEFSTGAGALLRIYIDRPEGIQVEDCERVSHQVSGVLDVEDAVAGRYTLEVSSPGMDRPLFTLAHFQRFVGERVKLRLDRPLLDGRRRISGRLQGIEEGATLVVLSEDGEELMVPFADVERARLDPEFGK